MAPLTNCRTKVQRYIVVVNIGYPTTGNPPSISTEKWVEASWVGEAGRCGPFADSWAMRAECLGVTLGWPKQPASLPELGVEPASLSLFFLGESTRLMNK